MIPTKPCLYVIAGGSSGVLVTKFSVGYIVLYYDPEAAFSEIMGSKIF